jgi:DNA-binding CsgD family transcriptional regulator
MNPIPAGGGDCAIPPPERFGAGWYARVTARVLDTLSVGVVVTDGAAGPVGMNRAAQRILRHEDGLVVRNGRLAARRVFESTKLALLIAAAAAEPEGAAPGRMTVGRGAEQLEYLAVPGEPSPSARDLTEFFGLSPAEGRLAAALMTGQTLCEIAQCFGLRVTTLRTQLSTILRKVGVKRQADLLRVLSTVRVVSLPPSDA